MKSSRGARVSEIMRLFDIRLCCRACTAGASAAGQQVMASKAPPRIFSRERRIANLRRARVRQSQRDAARYIFDDMVEDVLERLEFMRLEPKRVLVIGDLTGTLALSLRGSGAHVEERDVASIDEEQPIEGDPYDLIVSLASLDRVNDLPGALLHLRNALAQDGLMIASIVGAGSLPHLRQAMIAAQPDRAEPRMHPLVDNAAASALLQRALFGRQVVDSRTLTVSFGSLERLVRDLRDQGLGNSLARSGSPLGKGALDLARRAFMKDANKHGRVLEIFEILTLTGWKA